MKTSLKAKLKECLRLFLVFFKIGLFSFGGGYAMLTMIEHEVVSKRGWLTHNELLDIFAIAESTPGAISINIATFIGTKLAGILGGVIATFGVVLPAFLIIFALSYVLDLVRDNKWVNALFMGVRVGVIVLIIHAALKFLKEMKKKVLTVLLAVAMFCFAAFSEVNVIYLMLGSIGISIVAVATAHLYAGRKFMLALTAGVAPYERKASDAGECPSFLLASHMCAVPADDDTSDGNTAAEVGADAPDDTNIAAVANDAPDGAPESTPENNDAGGTDK